MNRAGIERTVALAPTVDGIVNTMIAENADQLFNVRQMRHVFKCQRVVRHQRSDHQRQRRIFRTRNRDRALELVSANNPDAIHRTHPIRAERPTNKANPAIRKKAGHERRTP